MPQKYKSARSAFHEIYKLKGRGRYREALRRMLQTDGVRLRPEFFGDYNHSWYVVGDLLFKLGNYEKAARAFDKSIKHWPADVDAYLALGNTLSADGRFLRARNSLQKAHKKFPRDARIKFNLANAEFDTGRFKTAMKLFSSLKSCSDVEIAKRAKNNLVLSKKKLASK